MSLTAAGPLAAAAKKATSTWWVLLIAGLAWIVIGFVVLRFDRSTVYVVSIVLGIMLVLAAAGEVLRAVVTFGGWRVWHVVFAILLIVAAVIAFVDPGGTFYALAIVVGFYFVFAGTYDILSSLFSATINPVWWVQLISGIAELVLGFLASSSLSSSVVVLVTYVSVVAVFRGIAEITAALGIRAIGRTAG